MRTKLGTMRGCGGIGRRARFRVLVGQPVKVQVLSPRTMFAQLGTNQMEEIVDTKVEALEGSQKKLTVTIDAEEIDKRIKKTYKDFASRYNFPGFRKGKAPRPVIDSMLGKEAVRAQVTDDVVNGLYPIAMDENDLISIAQPDFDLSSDLVEEHAPFTFTVTVKCRPEYELDSYDQVEVKLPSVEATDAEIDEQIDELRNYYYTFDDAADDAVIEENGFAEISLAAKDDKGDNIETISTDSRLYELGSGLFPKASTRRSRA